MRYEVLYDCVVANRHAKKGEVLNLEGFDKNYIARLLTLNAVREIENDAKTADDEVLGAKKIGKKK